MKLVFICNEYPPHRAGGIGVVLRGLCEGLAASGCDVHVVGIYPVPAASEEETGGVRVHRLPGRFGWRGLVHDRLTLQNALQRIAREGPIDVIEAPDFEAPTALLPRLSRVRLVRLHGSHSYFANERGATPSQNLFWLERMALAQADLWLSCSAYTAQRTAQIFGLKREIEVAHNAPFLLPDIAHKTDYREVRRAVYFGTLAEKKGVLSLAQSWRAFSEKHPDWRLAVIGPDSRHHGQSVRAQMEALLGPTRATVEFLGPKSNADVLAQLSDYDFAILPSFSEAFAIAPLEAMATGLPVIFTQLASGPELITDGEDGWLVDPRAPATITATLKRAAESSATREAIGRAGKRKVETCFSHSRFIENNLAIFERALAARTRR